MERSDICGGEMVTEIQKFSIPYVERQVSHPWITVRLIWINVVSARRLRRGRRLPMMELSLRDVLTWREWLWIAGLGITFLLSLYVISQIVKIMWRD
jgi:hypothetical protein